MPATKNKLFPEQKFEFWNWVKEHHERFNKIGNKAILKLAKDELGFSVSISQLAVAKKATGTTWEPKPRSRKGPSIKTQTRMILKDYIKKSEVYVVLKMIEDCAKQMGVPIPVVFEVLVSECRDAYENE